MMVATVMSEIFTASKMTVRKCKSKTRLRASSTPKHRFDDASAGVTVHRMLVPCTPTFDVRG